MFEDGISIKDMPFVERPCEKLIKYGPNKLSNSELLAIILGSGTKGENVVLFSYKLLKRIGTKNLPTVSLKELKEIKGVGDAKACQIIACFELGKRVLSDKKSEIYLSPEEVYNELRDLRSHKQEHFICFFLDARNQEIKRKTITIGTLTANLIHPREVYEPAIRSNAAQILVSHNHPSGDPSPSKEDIETTQRLVEAGKILGIKLVDHVIVGKSSYFSFKENDLIQIR